MDRAGDAGRADDDPCAGARDIKLAVHSIGVRQIMLVVVDELQMLVLGNVPVDPARRETTNVGARVLEVVVEPIVIIG